MIKKYGQVNEAVIINTIMNNSQDTIYFKDINSKIIFSSKAHALLWGLDDPQLALGKTDFDFFPEEFALEAINIEKEIMATGISKIGVIEKLVIPSGEIQWLSASKYPLYDENNNIIGTWGTSRDITALKLAEEELRETNRKLEEANRKLKILSAKDSLSGLYNQGYFYEEVTKIFNLYIRRKREGFTLGFSIIFFDVDNFKYINDTYGHLTGDFAIRHIAQTISKHIRSTDSCYRYGGDEFVIILHDTEIDDARRVAEKVRRAVEKTPINFMENNISVTISVGVAAFNEVENLEELMQKADERLYISKREGKNQVN